MCQLLGVSVSETIRLRFTWEQFARRGSVDGGNPDGWGVAYFGKRDVLLLREPGPAVGSPLVRFLERDAPSSKYIVSHVRRATQGAITLENTQPFVRYMSGRAHVFAHNGHVSDIAPSSSNLCTLPVGDTDSEQLFNLLLSRLEPLWRDTNLPSLKARLSMIEGVAKVARACGAANFIYCDGITLFVHAHRHTVPGQDISDEPGLYILERDASDNDTSGPCDGIACDGGKGPQAVVASMPLDGQDWTPLAEGEIACLEQGRRIR
ncbi:class II glutamine amidotransferase [Pseudomonadota bacterium]